MKRELGIGYCGLACALCSEPHCAGCKQGDCRDRSTCKNYKCCTEKGYQTCYECVDFPCEDSILHKPRIAAFCQYAGEHGEHALLDQLELHEKQGVVYHRGDHMLGDYDQFDSREEILAFLASSKEEGKEHG